MKNRETPSYKFDWFGIYLSYRFFEMLFCVLNLFSKNRLVMPRYEYMPTSSRRHFQAGSPLGECFSEKLQIFQKILIFHIFRQEQTMFE